MRDISTCFFDLIEITRRLREPGGCPWDREQTIDSMMGMLREECYEVIEAMGRKAWDSLKEELGDLLYLIIAVAQISEDEGRFDIKDVVDGVREKLVRRHPHVFGGDPIKSPEEVIRNWTVIKSTERGRSNTTAQSDVLGHIPRSLPALSRAQRVSARAARVGFDWKDIGELWEKVEEEFEETQIVLKGKDGMDRMRYELGDLLFTLVNMARLSGLDAEDVLNQATERFEERFRYMEGRIKGKKGNIFSASREELDSLWEKAKRDLSSKL